jgi:uncharacterized membrane protein YtjA (UPF0391 family)
MRERERVALNPEVREPEAVTTRPGSAPTGVKARRRLLVVALIAGVLGGGSLSAVPRAEREVTAEITQIGSPGRKVPAQMIETGYGLPFRTFVVQRGPVGTSPPTHANVNPRPHAVAFNIAIVGALVLLLFGRRRRERA